MENKTTEFIIFRLIQMPCCGQLLCWVNPRLPNYCPECGKAVWISMNRQHILLSDKDASIKLTTELPELSKRLQNKRGE